MWFLSEKLTDWEDFFVKVVVAARANCLPTARGSAARLWAEAQL